MELTLTQSQWNEACFVVELYGNGDSVSILNMNDKSEQGCGCVIQWPYMNFKFG